MEDSDDEIIAAKPKKAGPAKKPAAAAAAKKPSPAAGKPKPSRDVAFADGGLGELGWRSGGCYCWRRMAFVARRQRHSGWSAQQRLAALLANISPRSPHAPTAWPAEGSDSEDDMPLLTRKAKA